MTYSLKATGKRADETPFEVSNVQIGDVAGLVGSQQLAMQQNTRVLCKNPDGSQTYYTIDAERSTPANIVMKAV
jgi:hypothetical protein